jgi:type VI protein secretion system component Hcp
MPVYLQIGPVNSAGDVDKDKSLKGDVAVQGHVQWIDVTSYSFKAPGSPASGMDTGGGAVPGDVTFSRDSIDGISALLMRWSVTRQAPIRGTLMAIIHVVKLNQDNAPELYQEFKLRDVTVSAYQSKDNGSINRSESFTLRYSKMVSTYRPARTNGGIRVGFG